MALFLMRDPDCVFIHIHKTAGTSVRNGVWPGSHKKSFGALPESWRSYFSFAFVRDPIDRFLSSYRMFTSGTYNARGVVDAGGTRDVTLDEFIGIVLDENTLYDERRKTYEERVRHHTIPQTHPFNCLHEAQFVGRYWEIETDFQRLSARLGMTRPLPKAKQTKGIETPLLTADQEGILRAYYAAD